MIIHESFSPKTIEVFYAVVLEGLYDAAAKYAHLGDVAAKIGIVRVLGGEEPRKIPKRILFPYPNLTKTQDTTESAVAFEPVFRVRQELPVRSFGVGYMIDRHDFYNDCFSVLNNVPVMLSKAISPVLSHAFAHTLRCGTATNDHTGTYFFCIDKFGTSGNLYHHQPLTKAVVQVGMTDMASRCGEDNECLGLKADTLIVPPGLLDRATEIAKEIPEIKQVVDLPGLLRSDDAASSTTWYLASCLGPNGALALVGAVESGFEFQTNLRPPLTEVFCGKFAWAVDRYAAAGVGDPAYITRFEAGGPSTPSVADMDTLNRDFPGSRRNEVESATEFETRLKKIQEDPISVASAHTHISAERIAERIKKMREAAQASPLGERLTERSIEKDDSTT